ncbi:CatB-related O-acetyltransferase [Polynucleobacter nymphae]|uniref:CatB-related O-acetyltransferase n=1 Tax=Polynucleobacter nymphae TaxID=2081043 RepID=UPI001C0E64A1|nr:CatB-related O-acetyltransferase [Polynucleobacter nymphae]MBU3607796.1 CatB-related O-acetyltransferase [Polynucleobacter nymphae]
MRIEFAGRITNSYLAGGNMVGSHSTIARSLVGRYVAIGCHSFMSRAKTGNYCTFGNRVSIGGLNHDYRLVTSHEVAFRNTSAIYGETIVDKDAYIQGQDQNPQYHVEMGHDIWIGDNAVVLPGRKIGTGAVIGAGAVVTTDVPAYSIIVGNPGRILKYRFPDDVILRLLSSNWWDKTISDLKGFDFSDMDTFLKKCEC